MNDKRLSATRFIWSILGIILLSVILALVLSGSALDIAGSVLIGLLILATAISTVAIWRVPADWQIKPRRKAKRGDRVTDLLAHLEEEDVQERLARKRGLDNIQLRADEWYDDESAHASKR